MVKQLTNPSEIINFETLIKHRKFVHSILIYIFNHKTKIRRQKGNQNGLTIFKMAQVIVKNY